MRGLHAPAAIEFTEDMVRDARRRDFCAQTPSITRSGRGTHSAIRWGGIPDIREQVSAHGGARGKGVRRGRTAARAPCAPCRGDGFCARRRVPCGRGPKHRALIRDIAAERVFAELDPPAARRPEGGRRPWGPYRGLGILRATGVLRETACPSSPQATAWRSAPTSTAYDVLEHCFRCVRTTPRLADALGGAAARRRQAVLLSAGRQLSRPSGRGRAACGGHPRPPEGAQEKLTERTLSGWSPCICATST